MSVKCPACGFESPEGSGWCDFCKEPFNRKRAEAAVPAAPAQPAAPAPAQAPRPPESDAIPPAVLEKLAMTPDALERMLKAEAGRGIPEAPSYLRPLSWMFFAFCIMALLSLMFYLSQRAKSMEEGFPPPAAREAR